ncbi:MAG: hypothetical protein AABY68_04075 [Pseudomonadota bacterium]
MKKIAAALDNVKEIISYLAAYGKIFSHSLSYYDEKYKARKLPLSVISSLELKINEIEFAIINSVRISGSANLQKYSALNNKIFEGIFCATTPAEYDAVLELIGQQNDFFRDEPGVEDLVALRCAAIKSLQEIDGFVNCEYQVWRFMRIFLQRRIALYSYCHTQIDLKSKELEHDFLRLQKIKNLLERNMDFASSELIDIFAGVKVKTGKNKKDLADPESIDFYRQLLREKDDEFKVLFLQRESTHASINYEEYVKIKNEREALRYLIDEKTKALSYSDWLVDNAKQQELWPVSKEFGKLVLADIGGELARSIWYEVSGKGGKPDWGMTGRRIAGTVLQSGLITISNAFFGGLISAGLIKGIFSSFIPQPQDPTLLAIEAIKDAVNKMTTKLEEISSDLKSMKADLERIVKGLPDQIVLDMKIDLIESKIDILISDLASCRARCREVIAGPKTLTDLDWLLESNRDISDKIREILILLYGEVSLTSIDDKQYKVAPTPSKTSLVRRLIDCSKDPDYFRDFYTVISQLLGIHGKICQDAFELYNYNRSLISHAVSVYYILPYDGKTIKSQQKIVNYIVDYVANDDDVRAALFTIGIQIRANMIGLSNFDWYNKMSCYRHNEDEFTFDKCFALQQKDTGSLKWKQVSYDLTTQEFIDNVSKKVVPKFLINPDFDAEDGRYNIYCLNDDFNPSYFEQRMALDLDDQVAFMSPASEKKIKRRQNFRILNTESSYFDGTFEQLYTGEGMCLKADFGSVSIKLPVLNASLIIKSKNISPRAMEYTLLHRQTDHDDMVIHQGRLDFTEDVLRAMIRIKVDRTFDYGFVFGVSQYFHDSPALFDGSLTRLAGPHGQAYCRLLEFSSIKSIFRDEIFKSIQYKSDASLFIENRYLISARIISQSELIAGQFKYAGDNLYSDNNKYKFEIALSGNKMRVFSVCDFEASKTQFCRWTSAEAGTMLVNSPSGALKLYDSKTRKVVDLAKSASSKPVRLIMQNDRNLVAYDGDKPLWASGTMRALDILDPSEYLRPTERLYLTPVQKMTGYLVFQKDGNLVFYNGNEKAIWATGTHGKGGVILTLDNHGKLTIYGDRGHVVWRHEALIASEPAYFILGALPFDKDITGYLKDRISRQTFVFRVKY